MERRTLGRRVLLMVPLIALAACSHAETEGAATGQDVVLRVRTPDSTSVEWTLDRLAAELPRVEMEIDGQPQQGYLLLDVLEASGITDWERGEVTGKGEGRAFDVVLEVSPLEVDQGWILDVTNQGTLKLAADDLPRDRWVRDVSEISIE